MVQQVEATVVLLRKVNVAHHGQDLNDAPEVLSDGIVQRRVPIRVLEVKKKRKEKAFELQNESWKRWSQIKRPVN